MNVYREAIHSSSSTDETHKAIGTEGLSNLSDNLEYTSCEDATCVQSCHERSLDLTSDADMDDSTSSETLVAPPYTSHQLINISDTERIPTSETSSELYESSSISTETSHLLISSYVCRHHLTGKPVKTC